MKWTHALRNLLRNKRRTLATGTAIAAGFVGLVLLGGYIYRVERLLFSQAVYLNFRGHISIFKTDSLENYASSPAKFQITEDEISKVRVILKEYDSKIEHMGYGMSGMGLVSNGQKSVPFQATGVDIETLSFTMHHPMVNKWSQDLLTPDAIAYEEKARVNPHAISITSIMGELLDRKTPYENLDEDSRSMQLAGMTIYSDLNAVNAEVVASHSTGMEITEETGLKAPLALLQDLYQTSGAEFIAIYLKSPSRELSGLTRELQKKINDQGLPLEVFPYSDPRISPQYTGTMGFLYVMGAFFLFLISSAVVLSIINSLTMGILERSKEIGTLRAIGYSEHQIAVGFMYESLGLSVISGTLGTIIAWIVAVIVNSLNIRFSPVGVSNSVQFVLTPNIVFILIAFALFTVLVSISSYGLVRKKLNLSIVDLLSDSGA